MRFLLQCAAAAALGARAAGQTLAATKAAWNYQQARHLQESESESEYDVGVGVGMGMGMGMGI
jgi:hypothetical protein